MQNTEETEDSYTFILIEILDILILKICLICIVSLLFSQILFILEPFGNSLNSTSSLEGDSISNIESVLNNGTVKLYVNGLDQNYCKLNVFINGDFVFSLDTNFDKNIAVKNGDVIQIQGVNLRNYVKISISKISDNVFLLNSKKSILVKNNIEYLCKIKLR